MENWKWNEGSQGTTEGGELYYTFSKDGTYTITYTVVGKNGTGSDTLSKTVLCGDTDNPTVKAEDGFLSFDGKVVNHKDTQVKITKEVGKTIKLSLNLDKLTLDDGDDTTREELLKQLKGNITLYNKTLQKYVSVVNEDGGSYEFAIEESGEYRLTIRSYDGANLPGEDIINFSVNPPEENATVNYQTIGTILIVVACVILAGVVVYFVYSKVKNDKANKKKS